MNTTLSTEIKDKNEKFRLEYQAILEIENIKIETSGAILNPKGKNFKSKAEIKRTLQKILEKIEFSRALNNKLEKVKKKGSLDRGDLLLYNKDHRLQFNIKKLY